VTIDADRARYDVRAHYIAGLIDPLGARTRGAGKIDGRWLNNCRRWRRGLRVSRNRHAAHEPER
jgi:hypothetical protein